MDSLTKPEWDRVQEALCVGGLWECINSILSAHGPVVLSDENRRIIEQAYDNGDGNGITIVAGEDPPWFVGMYEDFEVCQGVEHEGVLYTIAHASGGGLVSVIVGRDLVGDEMGATFPSVDEAKAHIQGLIAG